MWCELSCSLVDISLRPVLSAIMSQLFPSRDHLKICDLEGSAQVRETDENCLTIDSSKIIAVSVGSLFTKLYPCKPVLLPTLVASKLKKTLYLFICFYEISRLNYIK